jgi:response regulator NasT
MTLSDVQPLTVLVADEDADRLDELAGAVRDLGHHVTPYAVRVSDVAKVVADCDPDVAIVALHDDHEHALELVDEVAACASGPVLVSLEREDPEFIAQAAERGIYAYVRPVSPASIQGAIDVALHRHAELESMSEEVDRLEGALERRALIEQAKGILMERHELDAGQAFEMMRKRARETNCRVVDLARHVIESRGL